jgi:hypothetical protein
MKRSCVYAITVCAILAILLGCERHASVTASKGRAAKFTPKAEEVNAAAAASQDAAAVQKAAKSGIPLPKDFPTDAPIPKGAKPLTSREIADQVQVRFEAPQPAAEVLAFYKTSLPTSGWQVQHSFGTPESQTLGATKGKRSLTVTISKEEDATAILVTVTK